MKHCLLKALVKKSNFLNTKSVTKMNLDDISDSDDSDGSISSDDEFEVSQDIVYKWYNNRYLAIKYLGKGTFCRTWLMYDIIEFRFVAMKMFFPKYTEDSKNELKINKLLKTNEYIVKLLDNFVENDSVCLIYELMGITLLDVLSIYDDKIPLNVLKTIFIQVFKGIDELHSQNIIHCDLKPENIMIKQLDIDIKEIVDIINKLDIKTIYDKMIGDNLPTQYSEFDKNKKKNVKRKTKTKCMNLLIDLFKSNLESYIFNEDCELKLDETDLQCKIIDLGNSEINGSNNEDEVMIRSYRPPENIMNPFYNETADIWTMGCIAYELITGDYLFDIDRDLSDNEKDREHLHQMFGKLGKIPKDQALQCEFSDELFDNKGRVLNRKQCEYVSIDEILHKEYDYSETDSKEIILFLRKLFDYNIKTRYSAKKLIDDEWLNN
jgi:serine/threonine-protein kinase SRPK3